MKWTLWVFVAVTGMLGCQLDSRAVRGPSNAAVLDLENRIVNPFQEQTAKAIVFFFIRTDCPISNRYSPEIERLAAKYGKESIAFWLIYPEAGTSPEKIEQHCKEYELNLKPLRDPRHTLVKMAQVKVTPEAAVFLPDGSEIYRGRIDDRYVDLGKERPAPTTHDLDEVLKSIIGGKPVVSSVTRAVGCYIE